MLLPCICDKRLSEQELMQMQFCANMSNKTELL